MFLTGLFKAATPENPRFGLNDPAAWDAFTDGAPASSGQRVNVRTALTVPAYWRGVGLIAGYVAKLPMFIYKREGEGKTKAKEHAAYGLVRWKANPDPKHTLKAFTWKQTVQGHALTKGNGYSYIFRDGAARPIELLVLDPESTFPVRENGRLWYVANIDLGEGRKEMRKLPPEDVHHIHGLGFDGVQGYDVITYGREALGRAQAQQKYGSIFFKNSGKPSVILLHPATLDKLTRDELRNGWERMHTGLDNAHRTAVLDRGITVKELTGTAKDAQLVEREKFSLVDIANLLGLPVHKVGGDGRTSRASLEEENAAFLDDCLDVWLVQWEEESRDKLLTEQEKADDSHIVEFMREALLRPKTLDMVNALRTATGGRPFLTPDEARNKLNMNPMGGEAAVLKDPLNMGQGGFANEEQPPAPPSKPKPPVEKPKAPPVDDDEADALQGSRVRLVAGLRPLLADACHRLAKRVGAHAEKAAKEPKTFPDWVDGMKAEHCETAAKMMSPIEQAISALTGKQMLGVVANWALDALHFEYHALAEACTAKTLAAEVARLNADLETRLGAEAVKRFLPDNLVAKPQAAEPTPGTVVNLAVSITNPAPGQPPPTVSVNVPPAAPPTVNVNVQPADVRCEPNITVEAKAEPTPIHIDNRVEVQPPTAAPAQQSPQEVRQVGKRKIVVTKRDLDGNLKEGIIEGAD